MIVHKQNLESLHKKVPKRILPTHLGGDAGDILDIAREYHLLIHTCALTQSINRGMGA